MQKQRMSKQTATAKIERRLKRGRPRKIWLDEAEEDLNILGIKNGQEVARDGRE